MTIDQQIYLLLGIGTVGGILYAWRVAPTGANALSLTLWPALGYLISTLSC